MRGDLASRARSRCAPYAILGRIALLALLAPTPAGAAEAAERVSLLYEASDGCPAEREFVALVRARTPRFEVAPDAPRRFEVALRRNVERVEGRLTYTSASGWRATRSLAGTTCEEVASAVALVTALAIDPDASSEAMPHVELPRSEDTVQAPRTPQTSSTSYRAAVEVQGATLGGAAPDALFGGRAMLRVQIGRGPFAQHVRAGAAYLAGPKSDVDAVGAARFTLATGTLEECPIVLGTDDVAFSPCIRADVGVLRGVGYIANARNDSEVWVDVGGAADARWNLSKVLFVRFDVGAAVPLTRVRFHFDNPDRTIHRAAPVGGFAEIGLGMYFL